MTPKALKALIFIDGFIKEHGYAPTFREIADGTGVKHPSSAQRFVESLVRRGYLLAADRLWRGISITDEGKSAAAQGRAVERT